MGRRKMKRAFSYIRYSKKRQQKGDSFRRQVEWGPKVCEAKGWVLDDGLKLQDLGVSAFRGKNAATGALAAFLEEIRIGKVLPGDVLLVESLDRLTREAIDEARELFRSILKTGVEIYTREPERHYTRASLNDFASIIEVLVYMERAHNESATKSMRGKDAWEAQRKLVRTDPKARRLHKVCPAWLRLGEDRSGFDVLPEGMAALHLIYQWATEGMGIDVITSKLNKDGVLSIGRRGTWTHSYVAKLLGDRSVLGEFQPHVMKDGKRVPHGEPIPGYFPRVISEDLWYAVRHAIAQRTNTRGRNGVGVANLFKGLIRDARDGKKMNMVYGGSSRKANTRQLVSYGARNGETDSVSMPFPYDAVEEAFLKLLCDLKASDVVGGQADDREQEIAALSGRLQELDHMITTTQARVSEKGDIGTLLDLLEKLDQEKKTTAGRLDKLKAETAHRQPTALGEAQSLVALLKAAPAEERPGLRLKIRARISQVVSEMWLLAMDQDVRTGDKNVRLCVVQVFLASGAMKFLTLAWQRYGRDKSMVVATEPLVMDDPAKFPDLRLYRTDPYVRALFDSIAVLAPCSTDVIIPLTGG